MRASNTSHYLILGMVDGIIDNGVKCIDAAFRILGDIDADHSRSKSPLAHCQLRQFHGWAYHYCCTSPGDAILLIEHRMRKL